MLMIAETMHVTRIAQTCVASLLCLQLLVSLLTFNLPRGLAPHQVGANIFWNIVERCAPAELQRPDIGDDRPAVQGINLRPIGRHRANAVGDRVEDLPDRALFDLPGMVGQRRHPFGQVLAVHQQCVHAVTGEMRAKKIPLRLNPAEETLHFGTAVVVIFRSLDNLSGLS